ncbi:MAG: hypothetical protein K6A64_05330 [Bacteroidales bacterium]|nr:hypothetical protein [Bacteroidales bacterium]
MKKLLLIALAACAMLSVSCKKDKVIDNTFTLGKTVMDIDFSASVGDDGRFNAGITFTGPEKPLYYDFKVEDIVITARLGSTTLPATQYFAWDFYGFESGTAKSAVKDGWLTLVVKGKLENGQNVNVRARAKVEK